MSVVVTRLYTNECQCVTGLIQELLEKSKDDEEVDQVEISSASADSQLPSFLYSYCITHPHSIMYIIMRCTCTLHLEFTVFVYNYGDVHIHLSCSDYTKL